MFNNSDLEEYFQTMCNIPQNIHFEGIDGFGDAVETIKQACFSEDLKSVSEVMNIAIQQAITQLSSKRHSSNLGYSVYGRFNGNTFIDDLDWASLVRYLPKRLFNYLGGFQAECNIGKIIPTLVNKGFKVYTGVALDLKLKCKFGIKENSDKIHHIDMAIEHNNQIYLIHIYKDSYKSKKSVKDKLTKYLSNTKVEHITKYRHGLTYKYYGDITIENMLDQLEDIFSGDRSIKIKKDGTIQFNDFE